MFQQIKLRVKKILLIFAVYYFMSTYGVYFKELILNTVQVVYYKFITKFISSN